MAGLAFRDATNDDVPGVVALVTAAYRGEASRAGWTTEADLLDGQRTDPVDVLASIAATDSLVVLAERDGRLVQTGIADGLGKGEQIYSVRFIGARGYVVTFKQTDPLYSLDLSDPAKPAVTGELKITGYSAHLQPVGENRLIGIGQEADRNGMTKGTQISLFDVSDPARPAESTARWTSAGSRPSQPASCRA